jgi:hypothetical protein
LYKTAHEELKAARLLAVGAEAAAAVEDSGRADS